jgi:hypothetical protein|tara:strand:- start:280 stop:510 length:231 start_codon:yes stop_codon:yes gene_type:complete
MMNEIRYKDLLTMEHALHDSLNKAKRNTARTKEQFDPESILQVCARDDERALITAIDVCTKVIETLRKHNLYTHTD